MWPHKLMPDPRGAERLLDYNCKVRFRKTEFHYPATVKGQEDFRPGTHMPKMVSKPVWLVEIVMPKQLMKDIHRGSLELEAENVDLEDLDQSYEVGLDDDVYKDDEDESPQQQIAAQQPAPTPAI